MKTMQAAIPLTPVQCPMTSNRCLVLEITGDGVEVYIIATEGEDDALYCHLPLDKGNNSVAKAVEELVYANPLLLCDFRKVTVIVRNCAVRAVPAGFGMSMPFRQDKEIIRDSIEEIGVDIVCPIDARLLKFLRRTFNAPAIVSHLSPIVEYSLADGRRSKCPRVYLQVVRGYADLIITGPDGLLHAVSYHISSPSDAVYFTLAAIESVDFDRLNGEIMVCDNTESRQEIIAPLRKYVNSVMPLIMPADFSLVVPIEMSVTAHRL